MRSSSKKRLRQLHDRPRLDLRPAQAPHARRRLHRCLSHRLTRLPDTLDKPSLQGLEQIKHALFLGGKTESTLVARLLPPTVVVFANERPVKKYMSADRWAVYRIDPSSQSLIPSG